MAPGISRRGFVGLSGASMLAELTGRGSTAQAPSTAASPAEWRDASGKRLNIIFFMPDEMRADSLACYGNPLIETPNIDTLARMGTRFTNCHVQYPVCTPSRCSMVTGLPTCATGHRSLYYLLRPHEPNMFRDLRRAGYDTFFYGAHNDVLAAQCFHDSISEWDGGPPFNGAADRAPRAAHTHFARSLMPQLHGQPGDPERVVFAEGGYNAYEPQCFESFGAGGGPCQAKIRLQNEQPKTISRSSMVRSRTHKLIMRTQDQCELYAYSNDPHEQVNLFGDTSVADVQAHLERLLLDRYINVTGVPPMDKDPRDTPPFYPTRADLTPQEWHRELLDA